METSHTEVNTYHFAVIAHPRSGSTLLTSTLASHSSVKMYGEVFNSDSKVRARDFPGDLRQWDASIRRYRTIPKKRPYTPQEDAAEFLRESVFYPRWRVEPLAIGFKIFYDHSRENEMQLRVWDYLIRRTGLVVIHLYRENIVNSWLSLKLAESSSVWAVPHGKQLPKSKADCPLAIDFDQCLRYCERMLQWRDWVRQNFTQHNFIELTYEVDLCSNFDRSILRIQNLLSIPSETLKPRLQKQRWLPYSEQFENYAELIYRIQTTIPEALSQS